MGILLEGCANCCCSPLRARYKRLVDNIFPTDPQDGLIKSNMEKLSYYASSSPEKLDRIGDYFAHKIARDLSRHYNGFVVIAMEAMDILLVSCNSQSLNLFIESYLKIVQLLLESQDPEMQLIATQSFTKFANIEEDTPSYHRRYDFFVSKFSSLCHDNNPDLETRRMLRIAGLKGLKGVIRKTVSDDLQVDIWDDNHMDKIVPSLLYNMQEKNQTVAITVTSPESTTVGSASLPIPGSPVNKSAPGPFIEIPSVVAEENLKELVGKATFGNIRSVIRPVLKHLDHHGMWETSEEFAIDVFRTIMNSIQSQHSYAVVQILMGHLDDKSKNKNAQQHASNIRVKTGIATVLSQIVAITASESIGPIVLDIINNLLNHLRSSINNCQANNRISDAEKRYQETVINSLGEFTNNIPDYQKIEIMMFIISRVPSTSVSKTDALFQGILLRSLLKVSTTYSTVNINQALPSAFLKSLLQFALASDPSTRLTVQQIFHQLLDRHNNLSKINKPVSLSTLPGLTIEKAFRQDVMFMKKHGIEILGNIFENVQLANNSGDNYCALYTTVGLLFVEMSSEEVLTETIRLCLSMQEIAVSGSGNMSESQKAAIHALVAAILHLSCQLTSIPALASHVEDVIRNRNKRSAWMLPESNRYFNHHLGRRPSLISAAEQSEDLLFDKNVIVEVLRSTGHDANRLLQPLVATTVVDSSMSRSTSDLNTVNVEIESAASSPGATRKYPDEETTFEALKKMLNEPASVLQEEKEHKRQQIIEMYRTAPFEELIAKSEMNASDFQGRLSDILSRIPKMTEQSPTSPDASGSWSGSLTPKRGKRPDVFRGTAVDGGHESDIDQSDEETTLHEEGGSITKKSSGKSSASSGTRRDSSKASNIRSKKSSRIVVKDNPFADLLVCNPSNTFSADRPPLFAMEFQKLFVY